MPDLESTITRRFAKLSDEGEQLFEQIGQHDAVGTRQRPACVSWLFSVINLLEIATPPGNRYREEAQRLLPKADAMIFADRIAAVLGLLKSASAEWAVGLLNSLEFQFVGLAFEQFLHHASVYLDQGKKTEAAVLASAVLEDTIKRLCRKHGIEVENTTLDPLINALKARGVIGNVKAQRIRAHVAVRNKAAHADWNGFDERDLRQMIEGVEELLEAELAQQ